MFAPPPLQCVRNICPPGDKQMCDRVFNFGNFFLICCTSVLKSCILIVKINERLFRPFTSANLSKPSVSLVWKCQTPKTSFYVKQLHLMISYNWWPVATLNWSVLICSWLLGLGWEGILWFFLNRILGQSCGRCMGAWISITQTTSRTLTNNKKLGCV